MPHLGPIAIVYPWLLAALALLPIIWWLLRAIPPSPRHERFPAIRLLLGLRETEQSPEHTPWWLLALRLLLAALVIAGLARPLLNPVTDDQADGLLIVVIDDGWAAGPGWQARRAAMDGWIARAGRNGRGVLLLTTAREDPAASPPRIMQAGAARATAASLQPKPWHIDRAAAARRLAAVAMSNEQRRNVTSVWLSDGLAAEEDQAGAKALGETLRELGPVTLLRDPPDQYSLALLEPRSAENGFALTAVRAAAQAPLKVELHALGDGGNILAAVAMPFAAGETTANARLVLPSELRNAVSQIRIAGVHSAAAVWLLDDRWKRRSAGLASGAGNEAAQPLLDDLFYLERAMTPFADIRKGNIGALLASPLSMLILADIGRIVGEDRSRVEEWLEKGGLLVRFAGPHMVEQSDDLIPVKLRQGGRAMGGTLSWDVPARLAPFPQGSPFFGLNIPADVTVARQILAQPEAGLIGKTWAGLQDGTPLVTAQRKGLGWIVLFHVTANMGWSNLPASGLYVEMLQRITELGQGTGELTPQGRQAPLGPLVMLDGQGQLRGPLDSVRPFTGGSAAPDIGPHLTPGYYGDGAVRVAVNLNRDASHLRVLEQPPAAQYLDYGLQQEIELGPWLLSAALILLLADGVIALALLGQLPLQRSRRFTAGAAGLLIAGLMAAQPNSALAQQMRPADNTAPPAALDTRLAYVRTGDAAVDAMSAAGLAGLTKILRERTAFEAADPAGVDPGRDELVFYPLLYWPMTVKQQVLTEKALTRIDAYMKNGGTILFDTRDQLTDFNLGGEEPPGPGQSVLREILKSLDIPPLAPVAEDHVLTKSYYLLRDFPGRYVGGQLWISAPAGGNAAHAGGDGVSPIVIGANDWAAAWAIDESGAPLVPVEPGGERQRELAYRTGVNLVMYSLTGNYKADQVHVPALLERLGQ